jgi:hypothetical protein
MPAEVSPHPNPPLPGLDPGIAGEETHVKRSMPSLIGGIFTAVVVFILWLLLFGTGSIPLIMLGAVIAAALGTWIRLADL